MQFGRQRRPLTPLQHVGRWTDIEKKYQNLRVVIQQVRLSVAGSWGALSLELLGKTEAQALWGHAVSAAIELLDPFETPNRLRQHWTEFPESVEGSCAVQEAASPEDEPRFNVTLFCEARAVDAIRRTIHFAGEQGVTSVLDIEIDYPGPREPGFWADAWRSKELRVRSWRVVAESKGPAAGGGLIPR
jgi:hypothetical protein